MRKSACAVATVFSDAEALRSLEALQQGARRPGMTTAATMAITRSAAAKYANAFTD